MAEETTGLGRASLRLGARKVGRYQYFHVGVLEVSEGCWSVPGPKCDLAASLLDDLRGPGTSTHAADPWAMHKARLTVRISLMDYAQADDAGCKIQMEGK